MVGKEVWTLQQQEMFNGFRDVPAQGVKQAIDLVVDCWNNVMPVTINYAWRSILEGLPEDRQVAVPGNAVTRNRDRFLEAMVAEVRQIPGAGFADMTCEDIREIIQPPAVTADNTMEEEDVAGEADSTGDEKEAKGRVNGQGMWVFLGHSTVQKDFGFRRGSNSGHRKRHSETLTTLHRLPYHSSDPWACQVFLSSEELEVYGRMFV
ncbi:hypothetical protein GWK47_012352 [Chionoecetes opilio]|uniref:Uncharacterized protein n=1 Tax=Chionoecetes opilio TaxID=41210 RepID=A0A8J4XW58_CHIOP|nr:hypothetical protein GWK47_012352 [Chionoecetes opilio]